MQWILLQAYLYLFWIQKKIHLFLMLCAFMEPGMARPACRVRRFLELKLLDSVAPLRRWPCFVSRSEAGEIW